jgi:hypothetical protein
MRNRRLVLNMLDQLEGQFNNLKYSANRGDSLETFMNTLEKCEEIVENVKTQIEREEIIGTELNN